MMRRLVTQGLSKLTAPPLPSALSLRHASSDASRSAKIERLFSEDKVYRPVVHEGQFYHPWRIAQRSVISQSVVKDEATSAPVPAGATPPRMEDEDKEGPSSMWAARRRKDMQFDYLQPILDKELPVLPADLARLNSPPKDSIQVTWVGHSTFLVQAHGINFLTDPVFSEYASPFQFIGPRRLRKTPLKLSELPKIDFICLSHNHYDHLDYHVTQKILGNPLWLIPRGLGDWFRSNRVPNFVELDWWDRFHYSDEVKVTFTPAQHWTKRYLWGDTLKSLWGNHSVSIADKKIFFACDTGYCPAFKQIGEKLGPFDLSLIPIGAYSPRSFVGASHVNPEEAVLMHRDLKSHKSIGMHWGTFILTAEPVLEPRQKLAEYATKHGLTKEEFVTFTIGQTEEIRPAAAPAPVKPAHSVAPVAEEAGARVAL